MNANSMRDLPLFTSVVHPWHCDAMGHMNTRFYAAIFDDASFQVLDTLAPDKSDGLGWADITWNIVYRNEVKAGTCVRVASKIAALGNKSVSISHSMESIDGQTVFATADMKIARFNLAERVSVAIAAQTRAHISSFMAEPA